MKTVGDMKSMGAQADDQKGRLSSVSMAIRILKAFEGDDTEIGVTELARRLGIAKSTVHRLVVTLMAEDFLEQNRETGRYRLGLGLFGLGSLVRNRMDLSTEARTVLMDLRQETDETVLLAVPAGPEIMYVRVQPSRQAVRISAEIGMRAPYHSTAAGRALLAFQPESRIAALTAAPLPLRTSKTVTDPDKLQKLLGNIRRLGYAVEDEENELGMRAIAAPIHDAQSEVVGAVAVAGPVQRLSLKNLNGFAEPLLVAARAISARLGHRGPLGAGDS
ncbi:IclR family transcriptional regulator [Neorhizobium galegae]|uniref:IclR family transcriptional regulator n=1 Tax=Neorhizobium galegae TaxID=399 RepID=UPI000621C40D|nr:IclR family transcriptional regulator [Neorhizobium galegae]CDZ56740.1 Transcriptional regulator KdgR [Neorhizobium galegae bv. orientalis]KAB1122804.1 IclR family transcriptional regulator [Neorhizobium galegae]MCQ1570216.1 IclR family transcriptional regulator [Neorhizobium galegae]MCQ1807751.1 IclR family transcriptional regulator [Neorhizobium galegae]MCQ1838320.1 IclR family transcriptional regulator [Neorhizobium galegae]